jgi:hypothetical protein
MNDWKDLVPLVFELRKLSRPVQPSLNAYSLEGFESFPVSVDNCLVS